MEFVELTERIKELGPVAMATPSCVDPQLDSYTLLRVQPRGTIRYGISSGVSVQTPEHNAECLSLLALARRRNADLVLFPEYCVGYDVLRQVAGDKNLWPENRKLWVLPCQGVPIAEFEGFLGALRLNPDLCLLEDAWTSPEVNKRQFVTALFYCFRVYCTPQKQWMLCLVPQLKTHPMSDGFCQCELPGMSTGGVIYTVNHRLITLLCADSLNDEITWAGLQRHGLDGLILLHPQLNAHPKHEVFLRFLREIKDHSQPGLYVSCNWAAGTCARPAQGTGGECIDITISWPSVYRKHTDSFSEKWLRDQNQRKQNAACGLFGAVMAPQQMEVWYSDSSVHALMVNLPNLVSRGFAATQLKRILADSYYVYDADGQAWNPEQYPCATLQQRISGAGEKALSHYSGEVEGAYRFPLDHPDKQEADSFWALTLAAAPQRALEMETVSAPFAWSLLLDEDDLDRAKSSLLKLWSLIHILSDPDHFPPRFQQLSRGHTFCYRAPDADHLTANLRAGEAEMIVSLAEDRSQAERFVNQLKRSECHNDNDLTAQNVGVFYIDAISHQACMAPEVSSDISQGDHVMIKGDIADGGN